MMMSREPKVFLAALFLALGFVSCSTAKKGAKSAPVESRPTALSRDQAQSRAKQIGSVAYSLWFGVDEAHEDYEGRVVINFDLRPKAHGEKVFLDFEEGIIRSIGVNGRILPGESGDSGKPSGVSKDRFDGHHIYFKGSELQSGANRIEISFSHDFSKNGMGFHRFKDPVDGEVYLYTDFEPYNAHRMFPCFDQPDLKASYELTVEAPENWQVVSNTLERDVSTVDGRKSWAFPPSPVFSTYLFALHAGPYKAWKGDANGIPLRLLARKSLAQYVDAKEWLDITKRGLEFYNVEFGYPYPYSKYDQIIVPDYNQGAMENVAAITFSERFVFRGKVTQDRHRRRADTILHEMAHMWFGDLVTMKWWNGLWLNESFATFMAARAVSEVTPYKSASWQAFFSGMKQWAYWEDQLVTTHPIDLPVPDTDHAMAIFDGVTYGKGASVLKQLRFFLGDDDFREGIQRYFQRFALKNTTLAEFIHMLAEASGKDLGSWQRVWLQAPGPNTVRADWACETPEGSSKSKITRFKLVQAASEFSPELRPHRTKIALYSAKGPSLEPKEVLDAGYYQAETGIDAAVGKPCPDFVFPNYEDYDFVKVELDPASLQVATRSIGKIKDPFTREMVWHTLWEMVIDGKLKAQDYAQAAITSLATEKDTLIIQKVLRDLSQPDRLTARKILGSTDKNELFDRLEAFYRKSLMASAPGGDHQLIWFENFTKVAHSANALKFLKALIDGSTKLPGLKMDQERRWEIVDAMARNGADGARELIAAELKRDATDHGEKEAFFAEASLPDPAVKKDWFSKISRESEEGKKLKAAQLREAMDGFHQPGQEELTRAFVEPYFQALPTVAKSADDEYIDQFANSMFPSLCEQGIVDRVTRLLSEHSELPAPVIKSLKVSRQEEERCVRARSKASQPQS